MTMFFQAFYFQSRCLNPDTGKDTRRQSKRGRSKRTASVSRRCLSTFFCPWWVEYQLHLLITYNRDVANIFVKSEARRSNFCQESTKFDDVLLVEQSSCPTFTKHLKYRGKETIVIK